jgi:hypothetical protein
MSDLLADLFKHPGFKVLTERVEAEIERKKGHIISTALNTQTAVDQRKIDQTRGFIEGYKEFLKQTEKGSKAFDQGGE